MTLKHPWSVPDENLLYGGEDEGSQQEGEGEVQHKGGQLGLRTVLLGKPLPEWHKKKYFLQNRMYYTKENQHEQTVHKHISVQGRMYVS